MEGILANPGLCYIGALIFQHLDNVSLAKCCQVCKLWHHFLDQSLLFYKRKLGQIKKYHLNKTWLKNNHVQWVDLIDQVLDSNDKAKMYQLSCLLENVKPFVRARNDHLYTLTPLHIAVDKNDIFSVQFLTALMQELKMNLLPKSESGMTPLHLSAKNGDIEIFKYLTQASQVINPSSYSSLTPLHLAAKYGHLEIIQYMHPFIKNFNLQDVDGWTPLHYAVKHKHLQVVEYLIKTESVLLSDNQGLNPFHYALESHDLPMIQHFLPQNVNQSFKLTTGRLTTPLHFSIESQDLNLFQELLQCSSPQEVTNANGWTLVHSAAYYGNVAILDHLLKWHQDSMPSILSELTEDQDKSPLHLAVLKSNSKIVEFLASQMKLNGLQQCQDKLGKTPLDYALGRGSKKIINILQELSE